MSGQLPPQDRPLAGCTIVITRPAGTGATLARHVMACGGIPLLLPGLSLRAVSDAKTARAQWQEAQRDDVLIFTSPAAVRYATALSPLATQATVVAVGQGTARALRRLGIEVQVPSAHHDSEGLLDLPWLQQPHGRRIALITAPDGRGLLQEQLVARGALLREVHVYRRVAPKLGPRHIDAVERMPNSACVLLSSAEAMQHLLVLLPPAARQRLCDARVIASSDRIAERARTSGFSRVYVAESAAPADLLARACEVCSPPRHEASRSGC